MKVRRAVIYGIIVSFILINSGLAFSQSIQTTTPAATEKMEPETEWLWGEVVSIDPVTNDIKVKTLDYKNDTEIEIVVSVDDKTTYENIKAATEIKPKDSLSIDYVIGPDGKNLAKNISLEKTEINDVQSGATEAPATSTMDMGTMSDTEKMPQQKSKVEEKKLPAVSIPAESPKVDSSKY
ncbi:MAG: hypothetical protein PHY94_03130 [Candidatus Omnitrophica bacterium]|nr:hypothetical protein [Candidatus Omnitrophota bacterium]